MYDEKALSILKNESATGGINGGVNASVNASVKLSDTQLSIISLLKTTSQITLKEIATKVGINQATVSRNINKLKQLGLIERIGSDKTGFWKVND